MREGIVAPDGSKRQVTELSAPPTRQERLVLLGLALLGRANISTLTLTAGVLGARETEARAYSTSSLKRTLEPFIAAGWVLSDGNGYECNFGLATRVLRTFPSAELTTLGNSYLASQRHVGYSYAYSSPSPTELEIQIKLGLAGAAFEWERALDLLLQLTSPFHVTHRVLREPLMGAFELAWFQGFSPAQQLRLARQLLEWCELTTHELGLFEPYAARPAGVVQTDAELRASWLRHRMMLGGEGAMAPDAAAAEVPLSGVPLTWHMVAGDFVGARQCLDEAFGGKRQALLPGFAGLLQVLLLLRGQVPGDLEQATRLANAGARKGNGFRDSFGTLKRLLACHVSGKAHWVDVMRRRGSVEVDTPFELVSALCVLWFKELQIEMPFVMMDAASTLEALSAAGPTWLWEQYRDVTAELARRIPAEEIERLRKTWGDRSGMLDRALDVASRSAAAPFPPLRALFAPKPAWEAAVARLEALGQQSGGATEAASPERVLWRVSRHEIEPYLQRLTPSGWTRGRKLAIKHLLPGSPQRATLPTDDLRVAEHARESVSQSYGYREVAHSIDHSAWQALIGHPRVFWEEDEEPTEVVRGTLQLIAKEEGDQFSLTVQPDDITEYNNVRREGERLVVYPTDKAALRVLEVVGRKIVVPVSERARLLAAATGVTHLIPLQSSAPTNVEAQPGETTPYFRLSPRGVGLSVAMRVRPLGERGPALVPGAGSPVLLAQLDGVPVQASRDIALELQVASDVIGACAVLEGCETASYEWLLDTLDLCLELLGALSMLGDRVRVEWPHGKPLTLRARLGRKSIRGSVSRVGAEFFLEASALLDDGTELALADLLRVYVGQSRFVRLEQGDFVELSTELREQLAAIAAARRETTSAKEVVLPPNALTALEGLLAASSGLKLDAPASKWRDEFARVFDGKPRLPRSLNAELRDYQIDGFRWLARLGELGFGACLADDMGLGKTVQLITLLLHRARSGPALVIAPTSVCENWLRELARFAPSLAVESYAGAERNALLEGLGPRDVLVGGYSTLQQDAEALQVVEWATVILDEAQFIKNANAQRTRAALALRAGMRVAATGTPVENHADDLYSLFQFIQPGLLGTANEFRRRFPLADDASGRESRRQLRRLIQPFLLRRTKGQVLAELPPLTEIEHQVELSREEAVIYEAVRVAALDKLGSNGEGNKIAVLAELTRLRRVCCDARLVVPESTAESSKLKALLELMRELTESGHRALVFSQFVDVLKLAAKAFDKSGVTFQYLDGSCTTKQRAAAIDAFQAGSGDAFLISLKAGGFGLNLTAADYVIHLDPWWNPAAEAQATDRAHRIGQQNPVTLYRLVAKGTIEERIVALHRTKRDLADSLLAESDQAAALSSVELRALLNAE
jgi:superfamily II DNA or RNA helicase